MNSEQLKAKQAPLKARYKEQPATAQVTMHASGSLGSGTITCHVPTPQGVIEAGLHPLAGGQAEWACSGEMLLQSLVACAGVTLKAVATALEIPLRGGRVIAEGDLDFRGTLGISKEVPIGFQRIRLRFELDSDATPEQRQKLLSLTERYCVIFQTLKSPPQIASEIG
jgi:uncharacterized OsmC-like protein